MKFGDIFLVQEANFLNIWNGKISSEDTVKKFLKFLLTHCRSEMEYHYRVELGLY